MASTLAADLALALDPSLLAARAGSVAVHEAGVGAVERADLQAEVDALKAAVAVQEQSR